MLDNQDSERCSVQISSLFELCSIILETKSNVGSFKHIQDF